MKWYEHYAQQEKWKELFNSKMDDNLVLEISKTIDIASLSRRKYPILHYFDKNDLYEIIKLFFSMYLGQRKEPESITVSKIYDPKCEYKEWISETRRQIKNTYAVNDTLLKDATRSLVYVIGEYIWGPYWKHTEPYLRTELKQEDNCGKVKSILQEHLTPDEIDTIRLLVRRTVAETLFDLWSTAHITIEV